MALPHELIPPTTHLPPPRTEHPSPGFRTEGWGSLLGGGGHYIRDPYPKGAQHVREEKMNASPTPSPLLTTGS